MNKIAFILFSLCLFHSAAFAQVDKDQQELEKERQQLKKDLEEQQRLLSGVQKNTKASIAELRLVNNKVEKEERLIGNINKDINRLDNNIYKSQRDVRRYSLLLDTLKQEYAKSMVYSYKNRSNADFLNFIFSSSSFNDAVKRISYLKSYRAYREMQGETILRTQGLLKNQITQLNSTKQQKDAVLQTQSQEMDVLAQQQKEKNEVLEKLKKQGKEISKQIAAKKKQMQKVQSAINLAIKNAIKANAPKPVTPNPRTNPRTNPSTVTTNPQPRNVESLPSSAADIKLNADFIRNRGSLPWPVDKGYVIMGFGTQELPGKIIVDNPGLTIGSDVGTPVKSIFDGEISSITTIESMQVIVIKHGTYFSAYSNLNGVTVSRGQQVHTGQVIGRVAMNDDGIGSMDLLITNEKSINQNPEYWLRRK